MERVIMGIDISKASFTAAVWDGEKVIDLGELPNTQAGYEALGGHALSWQQRGAGAGIHLILEVTGGYELGLVAYAYTQTWAVSLPNPRQVRDWARGEGQRAKNDRLDARLLTRFGVKQQPKPQQPLPAEVSELDNLLARRQDLEQMIRQERNRQGDLTGRPGVPTSVTDNLQQVIDALEQALAAIERAIEQQLSAHPRLQVQVNRLLALPGIGPKNVLPLLVLLERWSTLTAGQGSAKGLTAFVGLDPLVADSGSSVRKHRSISRMGDKEVRRLLYMGVLGGVRGNNPLRTFYQRLVGRGKAKKLALVAASRKLLTWAWAIFATDADWDPSLYGETQA
jgi:transposase